MIWYKTAYIAETRTVKLEICLKPLQICYIVSTNIGIEMKNALEMKENRKFVTNYNHVNTYVYYMMNQRDKE